MNRKVLVHVYAPATAMTHDMWIPLNISVNSAAIMIAKAVSTLSNGLYRSVDTPALFDKDNNRFLDNTTTVYEAGIGNASTLILI